MERLLPLEELSLLVALSIRLVLEDNSYSVEAAELRRVALEVGSTIAYSSSVEDLADSLGFERGSLAAFACD